MLYHSDSQYNNKPFCINLSSSVNLPLGPGIHDGYHYNIGNGECNLTHLVYTTTPQSYFDGKVDWDGKVFGA